MNVLPLVAFLLSVIIQSSVSVIFPEYDDDIHGRLIVSQRKFPFLTQKAYPDMAHYIATDWQIAEIERAQHGGRFKRSSNSSSVVRTRFARDIDDEIEAANNVDDEDDGMSEVAFQEGMNKHKRYAKYIGSKIFTLYKGTLLHLHPTPASSMLHC
jgi:hypothetical protein